MQRKSYSAKPGEVVQGWHLIDAEQYPLGRLASRVARILMGKHRPTYTPHVDTGEYVVVVNAAKLKLTGRKLLQEEHHYVTGFPGGYRTVRIQDMLAKKPGDVVKLAVKRMLPKTKLGKQMLGKLKVYPGMEHPHEAQRPVALDVSKFRG
ncbi:MAG: 50S ribosomal protein L13 [Desulfobacterales bacterium]|jgi:large subunit ribosomal protein L13|nr:50S ribosomal protein L13 [Desulfobacterales bacterium]